MLKPDRAVTQELFGQEVFRDTQLHAGFGMFSRTTRNPMLLAELSGVFELRAATR